MKKNRFIKSTIILIIGGFITKLLGMLIKIIMTRLLGDEGVGLYMLILPTFTLFIGLAQLGMPVAISKLVSEDTKNNKNIVFISTVISFCVNLLIIMFLLFSAGFIANNLIDEPRTYYALISIGLVLPFISISNIIRGYFFGKEKMIPHVISNITEDLVRMLIIAIGVPFFLKKGIEFAVAFVVLSNIISELTSTIVLLIFAPKNMHITKKDLKFDIENAKDILSISLPTTGSRLIGSIGYFLEPIIITQVLFKVGYSNKFIVTEYGVINGYVMPLLLLPSFFTLAISNALLPVVSNAYVKKKYTYIKSKIRQAILFSLLIGIPCTIIFIIKPEILLKFLYNSNKGIVYTKVLAPICLLYYIQSPLTATLQAIGKSKCAMEGTLIGMILRTSSLFILSFLKIGMWPLVLATSINIVYVTLHHIKYVKKYLR